MSNSVTIQLSDSTFKQLKRTAELAHQPLDVIVESSLAHALAPLVEDIPSEFQPDVYPLLEMNEPELRREALRRFPAERWQEYEALLNTRRERKLIPTEQTRLEQLKREADLLTFRKGYAAVLLNQRGYRAPSRQELEAA